MKERRFFVYMMASRAKFGAIYVGSTQDILRRSAQQAGEAVGGAAWPLRYQACRLVWFEECGDYEQMRRREVQLKKWRRVWKVELISSRNPTWTDLRGDLGKMI
ncbi:MAG: GIY-YIG nuclease family protein [Proteobacteria bacterium]|nr:GIY-YIG nuclease family protein [Pseudomonadota bacterium]NBX86202.1 GIY-YIG nuclease family protein [Pseudomonadota bacterium]